jgi:Circularly permutated YpsA SLOG family/ATP phosphoribosyltransferase
MAAPSSVGVLLYPAWDVEMRLEADAVAEAVRILEDWPADGATAETIAGLDEQLRRLGEVGEQSWYAGGVGLTAVSHVLAGRAIVQPCTGYRIIGPESRRVFHREPLARPADSLRQHSVRVVGTGVAPASRVRLVVRTARTGPVVASATWDPDPSADCWRFDAADVPAAPDALVCPAYELRCLERSDAGEHLLAAAGVRIVLAPGPCVDRPTRRAVDDLTARYPTRTVVLSEPTPSVALRAALVAVGTEPPVAAGDPGSGRRLVLDAPLRSVRDLNVFSPYTSRESEAADEGDLFERVRMAPGMTIVCGGQTGVNQVVCQVADELGFPCFVVLPRGGRTERTEGIVRDGVDDFGRAWTVELGSDSYRHRTWTTVFLADGTVVWDFHHSDGSAEARRAAEMLERPVLDLAPLSDDAKLVEVVGRWMRTHAVRVVNVEGNRGSKLTEDEAAVVRRQMRVLLRALAVEGASAPDRDDVLTPEDCADLARVPLRIGLPDREAVWRLAGEFYADVFGTELGRRPAQKFARPAGTAHELIGGRSADLVRFLSDGALDMILCHRDEIVHGPSSATGTSIVFDTGLFPVLNAIVGRQDVAPGTRRVVTQYPGACAPSLERLGIADQTVTIGGAAEGWVSTGVADLAFDTWRTGRTAEANRLSPRAFLGISTLVAARDTQASQREDVSRLAGALRRWLSLGGVGGSRRWWSCAAATGSEPTDG